MSDANTVLKIAAGEIGYIALRDPEQGSKYGRWMAQKTGDSYFKEHSTKIPWCAMFASWVFAQAGVSVPGMPSASCGAILRSCQRAGLVVPSRSAQPGDIVIFDWGAKDNSHDHIGIVELNKGGYIQTIEGNTSPSNAGSQGNGGGVWRRTRDWSVVQAIIRPKYEEQDMTPEQAKKLDAIYTEVMRTDDPSGRGIEMTTHGHIKWMARKQAEVADQITELVKTTAEINEHMVELIKLLDKSEDK